MMLTVLIYLFAGWILHFFGLMDFFTNTMGFTEHQYYLVFLVAGLLKSFITNVNNASRGED
jgi:hypothetical protein